MVVPPFVAGTHHPHSWVMNLAQAANILDGAARPVKVHLGRERGLSRFHKLKSRWHAFTGPPLLHWDLILLVQKALGAIPAQ